MFLGGLLLALPVMITLLLINIGLGVITRATPSLNIFSLGLPALLLAGFVVFIMSMESIGGRMEWIWVRSFDVLRDITGAGNGR